MTPFLFVATLVIGAASRPTKCVASRRINVDSVYARRRFSLGIAILGATTVQQPSRADTIELPDITKKVYMDIALCPLNNDASRLIGDGILCAEPVKIGRMVIGLYGNAAPDSTKNFLELATKEIGGYKGSVFQEIHREEFIIAGKQGRVSRGYIDPLWHASNSDITNPQALALRKEEPGTVSMVIQPGAEGGLGSAFSISTNPTSSQEADDSIVIGKVLDGLDVLDQINQIPTFRPSGTFTQLERKANLLGGFLGDQRAEKARESWVKPRLSVVITDSGMLE
ncbi:hypothetical protein AAMO2058_000832300 [Amorphochlora amoebiformis]